MLCRNCGTEIADKAIVCYRCGTGTTDPVRQPAAVRPRRGRALPAAALVLLVLLGLFLGYAGRTAPVPDGVRLGATLVIVFSIVLLVVRLVRRR
jgi:zinc-ribbon domain